MTPRASGTIAAVCGVGVAHALRAAQGSRGTMSATPRRGHARGPNLAIGFTDALDRAVLQLLVFGWHKGARARGEASTERARELAQRPA